MNAQLTARLIIRMATEADVPEVLLLERATATASHWSLQDYITAVRGVGVRRAVLVAAVGRVVDGFIVMRLAGDEAEIESVVVRAEARRQGLGSELCRAGVAWAAGEGAVLVDLEVRAGSAGAILLYGGLGFVMAGRRAGYYAEPMEDAVLMRRPLRGVGSTGGEA